MEQNQMVSTILRLPDVKSRTGLSRSTLYAMIAEGRFPQPIKLGLRAVGWADSEIADWLESRKAQRDVV